MQHTVTVTGAEHMNIVEEPRIHLDPELAHAKLLAEQFAFLGSQTQEHVRDLQAALGQ